MNEGESRECLDRNQGLERPMAIIALLRPTYVENAKYVNVRQTEFPGAPPE